MSKLVMFIGPSSCGKDTMFSYVLSKPEFQVFNFKPIILHTTRPKRDNEINGKEYHFVSDEEMYLLERSGKIIEKRSYEITQDTTWHYFTCFDSVDFNSNQITLNVLEGYKKFLDYYNKDNILPILFELDQGIRLGRALDREKKQTKPNYKEMCRRYIEDTADFKKEKIIASSITVSCNNNGSIEETGKQLLKIFEEHL